MFVCVPVREFEIEPCNKCCAFPDRIAETLTSSTAALPKKKKKKRTDVTQDAVLFLRNTSHNDMHLIIITLLSVIMKTKMAVIVIPVPSF